MTDHNIPLRFGGRPIDALLVGMRPALARTVLAAITEEVAGYGILPTEQLAGDIRHVIEVNIGAFVDVLRAGRLPAAAAGWESALRESAGRRAEEGIPVEQVLEAYHVGVRAVWDELVRAAVPDDLPALLAANRLMLRYLHRVGAAVAVGYLEERQVMSGDEHADRQALLAALLDGTPGAAPGLPARYEVLAVALGPHPDETAEGVDAAVAARRKLRRFRAELDRAVPDRGVLARLTPGGGVALVPAGPDPAVLLAAAGRAAGAEVTAGAVAAAPSEVAVAVGTAREVLDVARAFGRPPGLYRLDDVALEYQLGRATPARDRLAARLDPLADHPDLLDTLAAHLRSGRRRRDTAAALHVHPNTVDYRLRRVAALTGLDPTDPADATHLTAALAARTMGRRA